MGSEISFPHLEEILAMGLVMGAILGWEFSKLLEKAGYKIKDRIANKIKKKRGDE